MASNNGAPTGEFPHDFALWNLVIRPTRSTYEVSQLGPAEFTVSGVGVVRRDVELCTNRGGTLYCSHFLPKAGTDKGAELLPGKLPVVVYLHGNSSNRLEAGAVVGTVVAHGISLFCFDAAGCGLSDGEYVSLGWFEREDLAVVLEHLRSSPSCGPIGLWGRSMGAVTALLHADRDPDLSAICLDSPFVSLRQLAEDLAQSRPTLFKAPVKVPSWLVDAGIALVRHRVQALAGFDIEDVVPLENARRSTVPAIFMHARQDTFILPTHSKQLYNAYAGPKQMINIEGDHNSERSQQAVNQAVGFFHRCFGSSARLAAEPAARPHAELPAAAPGLAMAAPLQGLPLPGPGAVPNPLPLATSFPSWAPSLPWAAPQPPQASQPPQPPLPPPALAHPPPHMMPQLPLRPPGVLPGAQTPMAASGPNGIGRMSSTGSFGFLAPARQAGMELQPRPGLPRQRGGSLVLRSSSPRGGSLVLRSSSPAPQPQKQLPSPLGACPSHAMATQEFWRAASGGG